MALPNSATSRKGELVEFVTKDKAILHGFLVRAKNPRTCIIYVHGMGGNFYRHKLLVQVSKDAEKQKIAFFSANTRGHDAVSSIGLKNAKKHSFLCGTSFERFEDCVYDIDGTIKLLKSLGFRSFILVGHSTGSQKVVYYQYKKRNKDVKAIVLLSPADDYNATKKALESKFKTKVRICRKMVRNKQGNKQSDQIPRGFSAKRFLSIADTRNAEARIFDYSGRLKEFSSIKTPIYAVFGSREEYAVKPVAEYLEMLKNKTHSRFYNHSVIKNANHSFVGYEIRVSQDTLAWISKLGI